VNDSLVIDKEPFYHLTENQKRVYGIYILAFWYYNMPSGQGRPYQVSVRRVIDCPFFILPNEKGGCFYRGLTNHLQPEIYQKL
jgi:hypothetical protein